MDDLRPTNHPHLARRRWMAILARADADQIGAKLTECTPLPCYTRLRGPEAGLVMVRGRAGGGGLPFNLGEMAVTRCTIRLDTGFVGHAYIPGRETRHAEMAAWVDALMQDANLVAEIETSVIAPLEARQDHHKAARAAKAAATQVQFFAMQTMRT